MEPWANNHTPSTKAHPKVWCVQRVGCVQRGEKRFYAKKRVINTKLSSKHIHRLVQHQIVPHKKWYTGVFCMPRPVLNTLSPRWQKTVQIYGGNEMGEGPKIVALYVRLEGHQDPVESFHIFQVGVIRGFLRHTNRSKHQTK